MSILERVNTPKDLKKLNTTQLQCLAAEMRKFLVENVSKTGGHLASNLGVVELTIALHKVFDAPKDVIVWDVGHQSYVHKILTGRKDKFETLRQFGGISGFPRSGESEYDAFDAGHSSTSISAALGFACARDMKGDKNSVIAVLGDGAMSGGLAYEGLNNAGRMKTNFIVVLNNNEMSIAKNVGSMSKYLNKLRTAPAYTKTKKGVEDFLHKIPVVGEPAAKGIRSVKDGVRHMVVQPSVFEELGFTCIGPVDGHNIEEVTDVLNQAKRVEGPVMVHVITKKGKGYNLAERNPDVFHGIGSFDIKTGDLLGNSTKISLSKVFGDALCNFAEYNDKIVAITAAMVSGTGLAAFARKYPKRFFDVGIAEQHAVTFAGGLAKSGFIPVVAVYSTFLQRAYDQIFHDVALMNLHVVFCLDRAGLVGEDGETHHGILDLSYLTAIQNMTVLSPASSSQLTAMLEYAVNKHNGPIAIRYPKAIDLYESENDFVFGKASVERVGKDATIVAEGSMLPIALKAVDISGCDVEVIDVRTVKPIDKNTIINSYKKTGKIITIENNVKIGGLGSIVSSFIDGEVTTLGFDDEPVTHGSVDKLLEMCNMDVNSVAETIKRICDK